MLRHGLCGWNRVERRGLLRFLSVIEGKFTNERISSSRLRVYAVRENETAVEIAEMDLRESGEEC